jgi:hypothetical protein
MANDVLGEKRAAPGTNFAHVTHVSKNLFPPAWERIKQEQSIAWVKCKREEETFVAETREQEFKRMKFHPKVSI